MNKFQYILTDRSMTVLIDGIPHHVTRPEAGGDKSRWEAVKSALTDPDTTNEEMLALVKPEVAVQAGIAGVDEVELVQGQLFYNGEPVHSALGDRIVDIVEQGLPVGPWVAFAKNVYTNPAEFSRDELYLFLEKADLPITEDGCFLAYKNVTDDYRDIRTNKFDNSIGAVVEMPRYMVDQNRNNTCAAGLHFASKDYLPHYRSGGSRTMVVKINPADVVSIPNDYSNTKGRTWRYEVVGEIPFEKVEAMSWPAIWDDADFDDDDWYDAYDVDDVDDVSDNSITEVGPFDTGNPIANGFLRWFRK